MARQGFPVVLSAASGTGKTTLAHMLLEADQQLRLSISHTTRTPRGEEEDGRAYFFCDEGEFQLMIERNEFVEWAQVHGALYGSSATMINSTIEQGFDVLFDIDVQGGAQILKRFPHACLIFLVPPSMKALEGRLRTRGTDQEAVVQRRMKAAVEEIDEGLKHYHYILTNDTLERALFDLMSIVRAHRLRSLDRQKIRERLLNDYI